MTIIAAGRLDARNYGAVVHFFDDKGWEVTTTIEGVVKGDGMVYIYTPVDALPYQVAPDLDLNVYLASDAKYGSHSMKTLEEISDDISELLALMREVVDLAPACDMEPNSWPDEEVVPMEVPC